jgi:hypothetical protein
MAEQGTSQELAQLLPAWNDGDESPLGDDGSLVDQELRRLAELQMRRERPANHADAPVDERIQFLEESVYFGGDAHATAQTL